jgi:hypothetical protein
MAGRATAETFGELEIFLIEVAGPHATIGGHSLDAFCTRLLTHLTPM